MIPATRSLTSMKSKRSFVPHAGSMWKRFLPQYKEDSLGANKRLWGLFKYSKSDSKGVPSLKHQGNLITNAADKATVLNSYFQSVFTSHVPGLDLKQLCQNQCDRVFDHTPYRTPSMPPISITTADIAMLLDNLQPHKAAGPDCLSPMVLRELSSVIAPALQKIFSKSLSSHQVTEDWKKALVTPIFKRGDKDNPANYRPISLTCICSK